ncbi:MAG: pyrroline-5-carboxylate reductase, partial [Muribaculaceae bacterium]|nr:pyrroline-5-carboxylate reductase [Muribaculaceae bacterium]
MPNTAMVLRQSMTFIVEANGTAVEATRLFSHLGSVFTIPERLLPGATALASCGIAYAMRYVRAATEGGVELGFKASEAQAIIAQTLKGAVALLGVEGAHPETEIDKVTTPGGLTIRGLNAMEHNGFTSAVIAGLKASLK